MIQQPEALRIATRAERIFKVLEDNETVPTMRVMEFMQEAAAELRRLHAENETLKETLQRGREVWIASAEAWSRDVAEKDALLRQALGALEFHQEQTRPIHRTQNIIATIKQHLDQKGATK